MLSRQLPDEIQGRLFGVRNLPVSTPLTANSHSSYNRMPLWNLIRARKSKDHANYITADTEPTLHDDVLLNILYLCDIAGIVALSGVRICFFLFHETTHLIFIPDLLASTRARLFSPSLDGGRP